MALGGEKDNFKSQILFPQKKNDLKNISQSLKQKQYHALNQTIVWLMLVKHEVEHMPDIFENERSNLKL